LWLFRDSFRRQRALVGKRTGSSFVAKVWKLLQDFGNDEQGAAMAEYVVLLGLIVGALVLVITNFAGVLQHKFTAVCAALGGSC
jgi:pilus assembly protein Flp/PilA